MVHRALLPLLGWFLLQAPQPVLAEAETSETVGMVVPPAPAASETAETGMDTTPEPTGSTETPQPDTNPSESESPKEANDDAPVPVPIPDKGREVIIESDGLLRSESVGDSNPDSSDEVFYPKPLDFSMSRWWNDTGGMKWLPGHRDRFGMFSLTSESSVHWDDWGGLAYVSGTGFHFLNGPVSSDLPSKVFDFTWGLSWIGEVTPGWTASLAGRVGLFTDFEDSVRDGWRFPAHAVVFHDWSESLQGVGGVRYFDRENLPALPVVGLIFRPDDRVRLEAVFPEPRVAWRVHADEESQNWIAISGEIGGGEWAIERSNTDLADVVTYNDYSIVVGFHGYTPGRHDHALEIGYTFARDLEYESGVGNMEPDPTFFLRLSSRH